MFIALILSHFAWAEPSLYQKALRESPYPSALTIEQKSEQASGVLTLNDDFEQLNSRSWKWLFAVSVQSYQPYGKVLNPLGEEQELSNSANSTMPRIFLGSRWQLEKYFAGSFFELSGTAALAKQKLILNTANNSGLTADITSTAISLRPRLGLQLQKWQFSALAEYGQILTSLTSDSAKARYSKNTRFYGYGLSTQYLLTQHLNQQWFADLSLLQREALNSDELQKNNVEFGTVFLW